MDASKLNLILWIPFLLVVALSSIRFVISGFRRGFWMALVYLGISLAAAAIAVPVARVLVPATSGTLGASIANLLPADLPGGDLLLEGLSRMLGALIAYPFIFFILALVARIVLGLVLRPLLTKKTFSARLGGLILGILHAVIYPVLLLLPLYGTMAAFMPAAQILVEAGDNQDSAGYSYISVMAEHPVVKLCGTKAAQWYYTGLSSVELEGAALDLAGVSQSTEELLTQYKDFREADPEQRKVMLPAILRMLENTLDTKWCYQLICQIGLDTILDPDDIPYAGDWLVSLKGTPQKEYTQTVQAFSALVEGLSDDGCLDLLVSGDSLESLLQDPQALGRLDTFLESTPQTQRLKQMIFTDAIADLLFGGDQDSAKIFVTEVLANDKTKGFLTLTTLGALASAETAAEATQVLLQNEHLNILSLVAILAQNNLLDKLNPDFAQTLPGL